METIEEFVRVESGSGSGDGSGYGDRSGSGEGSGSGYGDGYGSGDGIKSISGNNVYKIDGVDTVIYSVHGNIARGAILQSDLTLTPCYIAKEGSTFAHGDTARDAFTALQEKLYDNRTEQERLAAFREHFPDADSRYPASELFVWHHVLTGSCRAGREAFCRDHGIDKSRDEFTIREFIDMTAESYGGDTVRKLAGMYKNNN